MPEKIKIVRKKRKRVRDKGKIHVKVRKSIA